MLHNCARHSVNRRVQSRVTALYESLCVGPAGRLEVGDRLVNHVGRKATDLVADGVF